jgi:hypothetical protein
LFEGKIWIYEIPSHVHDTASRCFGRLLEVAQSSIPFHGRLIPRGCGGNHLIMKIHNFSTSMRER